MTTTASEPQGSTRRFGGFIFDARTGELQESGQRIRLSPHLASLLEALIEHPGELVTREALCARVWPADTFVDFEHGLTAAVNKLREALDDSVHEPVFIETIPRRGYRWLVAVEQVRPEPSDEVGAPAQPALPAENAPAPAGLGPPRLSTEDDRPAGAAAGPIRWWRRVRPGVALAASLIVVGLAAWTWSRLADPAPQTLLASLPPVPSEAYDAYLRGRLLRASHSQVEWRMSVEYLSRAVDRAPRFARAHAALARAYAMGAAYGFISPRDASSHARAAASEALRLDDRLADAHVALGDVQLFFEWDWTGAESAYRRALGAEPANEGALKSLAWLLTKAGRFGEAVDLWTRLRERDPVNPALAAGLASTYIDARQFDAALDVLTRQEARGLLASEARARSAFAVAYAGNRQCDHAISESDRAIALLDSGDDEVTLVAAGWVYATCGRQDRARALLRRYEAPDRPVRPDPISLGALYAALGDTARALALVERGVNERSPVAVVLDVDLMLDPIRADPAFEQLAARVRGARPEAAPHGSR